MTKLKNASSTSPTASRMLLFRNTAKGFENVSQDSGPIFSKPLAARGLALGDFDNDGSVDVLDRRTTARPFSCATIVGRQNHWLGVRLVGTKSNIDAIGAKITYQIRRFKAPSIQSRRRQLSLCARSPDGFGIRKANKNRLAGNTMAATQRQDKNASPTCPSIATSRLSRDRANGSKAREAGHC